MDDNPAPATRWFGDGRAKIESVMMTTTPPGFWAVAAGVIACVGGLSAAAFDGVGVDLGNLYRTSKAKTRSISPENFTGEKGKAGMATEGTGKNAARDLGQGWKVSPSVRIEGKTTFTLATIEGPGIGRANV